MNIVAYEENERNKKHCTYYPSTGYLVVDGYKATYRGTTVSSLSHAQRRKFETLLMLMHVDRNKSKPLKIAFR